MFVARYTPTAPEKPQQFMSVNNEEVRKWAQAMANLQGVPIRILQQVETEIDYILPQKEKINASD